MRLAGGTTLAWKLKLQYVFMGAQDVRVCFFFYKFGRHFCGPIFVLAKLGGTSGRSF